MRTQALRVALVVTALSGTAVAQSNPYAPDPTAPPVRADEARGWEREPTESKSVIGSVGRGIGAGAGFVLDVLSAPLRGALWLEDHHRVFTRTRDAFYNNLLARIARELNMSEDQMLVFFEAEDTGGPVRRNIWDIP